MKTSICIPRKCLLSAAALLLLLPIGQAWAADITVDADCSLPNAIRSANGEELLEPKSDCEAGDSVGEAEDAQADGLTATGLDTITIDFAGTNEGTIALSATLAINSAIVIDGSGYGVNGGGNQIFSVAQGSLTLNDLTMSNGFSQENGGAISVTGGVLTLNNSAVSGSGARGLGGGIYAVDSDVTLVDSVVSGNATAASAENYPPAASQTESTLEAETIDVSKETVIPPAVEGSSGGGIYFDGESSNLIIDRSGCERQCGSRAWRRHLHRQRQRDGRRLDHKRQPRGRRRRRHLQRRRQHFHPCHSCRQQRHCQRRNR